ncbi:MAG: transcriptional regulator NanR [Alphaproteobacteria bacterium]|nr:transcriptional regulator NanR [Alphaproteobacteria bacterium]
MKRPLIRRRKLYEEIAAEFERRIVEGDYAPGDQLPSERKIMEEFGTGRPAVREALFALTKMGLVALNSGEPARVTKPTPDILIGELAGVARALLADPEGVRQFQNARMLFETALVREAATNATAEDVKMLSDALDANKKAVGTSLNFERTDVEFHYVLAIIARNPILTALHEGLLEWLSEQRAISNAYPGATEAAIAAHTRIFDAVAAHDAVAAEAAMREHLGEVARTYWEVKAVR